MYSFNNIMLTSSTLNYFAVPLGVESLIILLIIKNSYKVPKSPQFKHFLGLNDLQIIFRPSLLKFFQVKIVIQVFLEELKAYLKIVKKYSLSNLKTVQSHPTLRLLMLCPTLYNMRNIGLRNWRVNYQAI